MATLSRKDEFAIQIAAALVATKPQWGWTNSAARELVARDAYDIAEALIAESETRDEE